MGFRFFLLQIVLKIIVIINIVILNDIVATLQFLLIKVYQVTEKQFSTQFQWKDKINKHLHIIQSCAWKQKVKWLLLSKFPNSILNWRSRHQACAAFYFWSYCSDVPYVVHSILYPSTPHRWDFLNGVLVRFSEGINTRRKVFLKGVVAQDGCK